MEKSTINYGSVPVSCKTADVSCINNRRIAAFLLAVDKLDTGKVDGFIDVEQIQKLVGPDAEITQQEMEAVKDKFNQIRHPAKIKTAPTVKDFKLYLSLQHPDIYEKVFKKPTTPKHDCSSKTARPLLDSSFMQSLEAYLYYLTFIF